MNYIQDLAQYIQYFRDIKAASTYFKFFEQGGSQRISDRLVNDSRGIIDSPLLFVEWPFIKLNDYGSQNTQARFTGAFAVLENPAKDDWAAQDASMNSTLLAGMQVLNQMKVDNAGLNKKFLYFDLNSVSIDPVENMLIDQWYGWRFEFAIMNPVDISTEPYCLNPTFWI